MTFYDEYWKDEEFDRTYIFKSDRDEEFETKKWNAVLYMRAHKKLLKDEKYKNAYNKIIDEYVRETAYISHEKAPINVSEEERECEGSALDVEISRLGKREIAKYKSDADYIAEWVAQGKSLILYV